MLNRVFFDIGLTPWRRPATTSSKIDNQTVIGDRRVSKGEARGWKASASLIKGTVTRSSAILSSAGAKSGGGREVGASARNAWAWMQTGQSCPPTASTCWAWCSSNSPCPITKIRPSISCSRCLRVIGASRRKALDSWYRLRSTAYNAGLFQGLTSLKVVWDHRRIVVNPYPATRLRPFSASVGVHIRCPPWRAKRRRVVPGSREATRDTRRAEGAKGDPKGASERGVQSYGRPVCSRNELAMLWRNAG